MELVLRGSEYQSFLTCRKQWFYQWVMGITPKRPDGKLFFGTLFHKWMQLYYNSGCNKIIADMETTIWLNEQDTKDMEQTDIDDMLSLMRGVAENYNKTYYHNDSKWKILGTEVEFIVKLEDDMYYTGTIDLVYEVDGKIRFADHKTVASLTVYEEKSKMDRQISRYWWALEAIAKGIGRVKTVVDDKEMWVRWEELIGKEIDGFDYNLIAKDFPKQPRMLKAKKGQSVGDLSQDKSQKTTYDMYLAKIKELNLDPNDYIDMLEMLKNKPDPFLKRVNVLRNASEKESAMWEFMYTAGDIHDVKMMISQPNVAAHVVEASTYRNIGEHCSHMCSFRTLCQTTIEGGNVSMIMNLGYKKREEN